MLKYLCTFVDMLPQRIQSALKELFFFFEFISSDNFKTYRMPRQVEIETNSRCNRACTICPRSTTKKEEGAMEMWLLKKILTELKNERFSGRISPVFYNEPTIDPNIEQIIREMRAYLPSAKILLYTNGSTADSELYSELSDAGVDLFNVSCFEGNLEKDGKKITSTIKELPDYLKNKIRFRVLRATNILSNRGGLVRVPRANRKRVCVRASVNCVIAFNGDVLLCCNDYLGEYVLGNLKEKSLKEIWNSPEVVELHRELRGGYFRKDICKKCTGY